MRGGGRGGGGRPQPSAAGEGAEIPQASRKLVQGLKGILSDHTEAEIYAVLLQCGMDPDVAVERLMSQDPFHEVRRKRNNKKEVKAPQETRSRPNLKSAYRGSKTGSDRSGRVYSGLGESTGSAKGPIKKEPELLSTTASDYTKAGNPMEKKSSTGNVADVKSATFQPPTQPQHGWVGMPGHPSMADIVRMGRAHPKSGSRPVGNSAGVPAVGDPIVSSATKTTPKDSHNTVLPSEVGLIMADKLLNETIQVHSAPKDDSVDILPLEEGLDVLDSFGAASMNTNPLELFTPDANEDDIRNDNYLEEIEEMTANNANVLSSSGPVSVSDKNMPLNNDLVVQTEDYQSDEHSLEGHKNSNGDMSTTVYQMIKMAIHEETKSKAEDNPAVIIPGHLQVSNTDFAHLTFGSFVSGTLDTSRSTKPANSDGEVGSASDNHSSDQSDVRSHEYEDNETIIPEANEYIASATNSNTENSNITPAHQSEVARADLIDATNSSEYNLPSQSDYTKSSAGQPESAAQPYLQENHQMQNISSLSSFMQANMQSGLLPPAMPAFRELDPAFSLLLTNPPLATMMHGMTPSSVGNTTVPTKPQENVSQGGLSNPQLAHSQASTSIAPGPPLPHHIALHPYAQPTLPLGYANMIGYPSLPQSYAYLTPAAYQQPYMNTGIYHQAAAAPSNPGIKYPMPPYKSNVPLASLPQPASLLSSYVGGFGPANGIPGNFALNQSATSSATTVGFDGTMPMQYKDANHYFPLPQNENPPMWMHGAGSPAMAPMTGNTLYGYQGQQGHQGGIGHSQQPSQFGATLRQSQTNLGPEQRNPSDSNLSASGQANQLWPNSY